MKKALVHDWYYTNGGAEKVIHSINNIWDDLEHFALVDFLNEEDRAFILGGKKVGTTFIQNLPTAQSNHRKFLQLFPLAIEQLDLSDYDLVLSSSASVAKGVLTGQNQLHICYCHSPMRYAWDLYHQYLNDAKFKGLKSWYAKRVLNKIRIWDVINTNRVDHLIANSNYISKRIQKVYRRKSHVIYPPVDVEKFGLETNKENYYITASRLVPYKKIDIIVEAFSKLPNEKLLVIGNGPEMNTIKQKATKNIEILGHISNKEMIQYMQKAKGFIFAAEEDFGIVPVEAQACGTPVLAFGKGGALETIQENVSGSFFYEQTPSGVIDGLKEFNKLSFDYNKVRENSIKFSKERFEVEYENLVNDLFNNWKNS